MLPAAGNTKSQCNEYRYGYSFFHKVILSKNKIQSHTAVIKPLNELLRYKIVNRLGLTANPIQTTRITTKYYLVESCLLMIESLTASDWESLNSRGRAISREKDTATSKSPLSISMVI